MGHFNRRRFLQFSGSALATIGLSQFDIMRRGDQYGRVLAQPTARKLALLIGIDDYSRDYNWNPLRGCVHDVLMQEELLVHRFGFSRNDILKVTDQQATREGILTAFDEHLIKQARPGDVVVVHFSGHGSRVVDPNPYRDDDPLNSTLVPIDSPLPEDFDTVGGEVNDLMGRTLFLLMRALDTEHVTVVLDSCHSGGGKRGTMTVRSRDGAGSVFDRIHPSETELAYQEELRNRQNLSEDQFYTERRQNIAKGVVIASAAPDQLAADSSFGGFHAGAFTYMMTQYLWQITADESVGRAIANIGRATRNETRGTQSPEFEANVPDALANTPIYFSSLQTPPADAIITRADPDNQQVHLWLGGVHPDNLFALDNSILVALDQQGEPAQEIRLLQRNGMEAIGEILRTDRSATGRLVLEQGTLVQEDIRGIPADLQLRVAVDPALAEFAAAQQALAAVPRLEVKSLDAGDVDYIFGRLTPAYREQQTDLVEVPPTGGLGLFRDDLTVLPGSFGEAEESVPEAIARLRSRFSMLLAIRLLHLLGNSTSSRLDVAAALRPVGTNAVNPALQVRGTRSVEQDDSNAPAPDLSGIPADASRLPVGTVVELEVDNNANRDLYISVLVIDPEGNLFPIFPTNWDAPEASSLVPERSTLLIPDTGRGDNFQLRLVPPLGVVEVLVLASITPLRNTLLALGSLAQEQQADRGVPINLGEEALDMAELLMSDLDNGTRGTRSFAMEQLDSETRGVSSAQLAAYSIFFELYDPAQS